MTSHCSIKDLRDHPVKVTAALFTFTAVLIGLYVVYFDQVSNGLPYAFMRDHFYNPDVTDSLSKHVSSDVIIQRSSANASALKLNGAKLKEILLESDEPTDGDSVRLVKIDWINVYSELTTHVSTVKTAIRNTLELDGLPYLKNFRNPCWLEKLPKDRPNPYSLRNHKFEMMAFQEAHLKVKSQYERRRHNKTPYRMRCLPYYYIIGPQKSGTTDLYKSLTMHPGVVQGMAKEPHWWARSRIAATTLEEYVDLYDQAAETIAKNALVYNNGSTYHPYITGDATPELIWDNWDWQKQPENSQGRSQHELHFITADHIYHVTPQARIIAMLRDPVTRLWSDYNYFGHGWTKTSSDYHGRVMKGLKWLKRCLSSIKTDMDRRHCIYDSVPEYGGKYGGAWNPVVRLRMGLYSEMLIDWFNIFPRDQILILKMEDYATDRVKVLNKILTFLGLDELPETLAASLQNKQVANAVKHSTYKKTGQVFENTLQTLKEFYKPYNEKIAKLTGNQDFLQWNS